EQRIRESEYKYRTLVEQGTDSIFIGNFQGHILAVNPAGCQLSQYDEQELLRMRFHDLADADELKTRPFMVAEIIAGDTSTTERRMRRKDGQMIDVEMSVRMIAPNRVLAFLRDITERKKAVNELISSTEYLRQLNTDMKDIHEAEKLNVSK